MAGWFKKWSEFDSARSLGEWAWWGLCWALNITGASVMAWLSAYWDWYWATFNKAGYAIAFLVSWVVLPAGFILMHSAFQRLKPVLPHGRRTAEPARVPAQETAQPEGIVWAHETGEAYIVGLQKMGNEEEAFALSFQFNGTNNTGKPIESFSGYVRSDVTNLTLPLYLNCEGLLYRPDETYGIPIGAMFGATTGGLPRSVPERWGMIESRFRIEFARATLVVNFDGNTYERQFNQENIDLCLKKFRESASPQNTTTPRVTPRPGSVGKTLDKLEPNLVGANGG